MEHCKHVTLRHLSFFVTHIIKSNYYFINFSTPIYGIVFLLANWLISLYSTILILFIYLFLPHFNYFTKFNSCAHLKSELTEQL